MKTYLRVAASPSSVSAQGFVQTLNHQIEWVGSRKEATADYLQAAQATQQKLEVQLGIHTALEELPSTGGGQPKWVVCRVEPLSANSARALAQSLAGKPVSEAIQILHRNGLYVAFRFVDGELTYPVYSDPEGQPAHGVGPEVAKVRLDVEHGNVTAFEFFPECAPNSAQV
jgi:hypothetical protein